MAEIIIPEGANAQATPLIGALREVIEILIANGVQHELVREEGRIWVRTPNGEKVGPLLGGLPRVSDVPIAVKVDGDVEQYVFPDTEYDGVNRRAWWGPADELVARGVATPQQVQRVHRWSKCGRTQGVRGWSAMHAPSGRVYFCAHDEKPREWLVSKRARTEAVQRARKSGEALEPIRTDNDKTICWFGRQGDLVAAGVCPESQFPVGRRRLSFNYDAKPHWRIERISGEYFEYVVDKDESEIREPRKERGPAGFS